MPTRILAALIGLFHSANGLAMVVASRAWFDAAPGAGETGAFNPHFVMDVGLAFLAGGIAFLAFAWRPSLKLAALGCSGFLASHALLHLASAAQGHVHNLAADLLGVVLPAFAGLALAWPRAGDAHA